MRISTATGKKENMKERRDRDKHFLFAFTVALLQAAGATELGAKNHLLKANEWHVAGGDSIHLRRPPNEEELLRSILPHVTFNCIGKTGYFPDAKFGCEVFHYCKSDGMRNTFHCPKNSIFNQLSMGCEGKNEINRRICAEGSIVSSEEGRWTPLKMNQANTHLISGFVNREINHMQKPMIPIGGAHKLHQTNQDQPKSKPVKLEKLLSIMAPADKTLPHIPPDLQRLPSNINTRVFIDPDGSNVQFVPKTGPNSNEQPITITEEEFSSKPETNTRSFNSTVVNIPETDTGNALPTQKKRKRQHLRKGRVLDLHVSETKHKEQPHASHLHAETTTLSDTSTTEEISATTAPARQQIGITEAHNSTTDAQQENDKGRRPKLFGVADRRPKDFKSQRSRRRKTTSTTSSSTTTTTTTTTPSPTTTRSRVESIRIDNEGSSSIKKAQSNSEVFPQMETIDVPLPQPKPYKLPPLPESLFDLHTDASEIMDTEDVVSKLKKNWIKATKTSFDDDNTDFRFGDRSSSEAEPHRVQYKDEKGSRAPTDIFGGKGVQQDSDERVETRLNDDHVKVSRSHRVDKHRQNRKPSGKKQRNRERDHWVDEPRSDEEDTMTDPKSDDDSSFEDIFPPPRARNSSDKRRRQKSSSRRRPDPPKGERFDDDEGDSEEDDELKTGDDDRRHKTKYSDHYLPPSKDIPNIQNHKWKLHQNDRIKVRKIKVGSSADGIDDPLHDTSDGRLALLSLMKDLALPSAGHGKDGGVRTKVGQLPKNTAVHRQLSKLINEFFSKEPEVKTSDTENNKDLYIPKYRILDEDIYDATEAAAKDVDNIPQEVLEVIRMISGETDDDDLKEEARTNAGPKMMKVDASLREILGDELAEIVTQIKNENNGGIVSEKGGSDDDDDDDTEETSTLEDIIKKLVLETREKEQEEERASARPNKEQVKGMTDLASFTSLRLGPILKSVKSVLTDNKPIHLAPLGLEKTNLHAFTPPKTKSSSNNVPMKVFFRGAGGRPPSTAQTGKPLVASPSKSNFKIVRSMLPRPNLQVIHNNRMIAQPNSQFVVLHPSSLVPPHPPPLPQKMRSSVKPNNFHRSTVIRPMSSSLRPFDSRHRLKRSATLRTKRQIPHFTPNIRPFYNPLVKPFNPNFRHNLRQGLLRASGSHPYPFLQRPPSHPHKLPQPTQRAPFLPRRPLHGIHQTSEQTMIMKEIPVPVQATHVSHFTRGPNEFFRPPLNAVARAPVDRRPPAIQKLPLVSHAHAVNHYPYVGDGRSNLFPNFPHGQHFLDRNRPVFPQFGPNFQNPFPGHPFQLFQPSIPVTPPTFTPAPKVKPPGQVLLRKPPIFDYSHFSMVKPIETETRVISTTPSYPTTQKTIHGGINDNLKWVGNHNTGLVMHSGYKPPKEYKTVVKPFDKDNPHAPPSEPASGYVEVGFVKNITPSTSSGHGKPSASSSSRSNYRDQSSGRSLSGSHNNERKPKYPRNYPPPAFVDPSQTYRQIKPRRPNNSHRPSTNNGYKDEPFKPILNIPVRPKTGSSTQSTTDKNYYSYYSSTPPAAKIRKSRPVRKRRPKTQNYPLQTPSPPQQIPPPPSTGYTSMVSLNNDASNSINQPSLELITESAQNSYRPPGYYVRNQNGLYVQSNKDTNFPSTQGRHASLEPNNHHQSSSDQPQVDEDGEPVFGARINPKSGSRTRKVSRKPLTPAVAKNNEYQTPQSPRHRDIYPYTTPKYNSPPPRKPDAPKNPSQSPVQRRRRPAGNPQQSRPTSQGRASSQQSTTPYPKPVTPSPDFFSMPTGLGGLVAPEKPLQPGADVPRDMFGIPIPFGSPNLFHGFSPPGNHQGFFSVPPHVARQHQSPLQTGVSGISIKSGEPNFFAAATEHPTSSTSTTENTPQKRKVIKGRRRKRIKVKPGQHGKANEENPDNKGKAGGPSSQPVVQHISEIKTTSPQPPVTSPRSLYRTTSIPRKLYQDNYSSHKHSDKKDTSIPSSLEEVSKSLLEGKLDIRKLNATISTSMSVSANAEPANLHIPESKKVFSSKNGGLAVVKKSPRTRKRPNKSQSSGSSDYLQSNLHDSEKLQIASSILDIIKATTEQAERLNATGSADSNASFMQGRSSSKSWILKPSDEETKQKSR